MKVTIHTVPPVAVEWLSELPIGFPGERLGGAELLAGTMPSGVVCVQEFEAAAFSLRYVVVDSSAPARFKWESAVTGLSAFIVLRGALQLSWKGSRGVLVQEGQFTLFHAQHPELDLQVSFPGNTIFFEVLFSDMLTVELVSEFEHMPAVFSRTTPELWVHPPRYIDEEVKDHLRYIMNYADNPAWRRNYYENQVWDIGWKLLALYGQAKLIPDSISNEDREKAHAVQKLIVDHLDKHLLIRELARKLGTSQSGLKKIFTKVYGTGIHEYRIQQRLKRAVELLQQGKLVKEAAALTGWRSANLIKAYKKQYGTTPAALRRNKP